MAFTSTTTTQSVTYQNWGYHVDNTYINNSGGFVGNDDYWEIKKPIDVSYEASIGGSFTISGMTFFESNRTNVNFYSSTSVDSSKRISTVYISSQNQKVNVPSNAKIMVLCVRTISPNESASVKVSLRQQVTTWNTSDKAAPTAGTIYDFNGTTNNIIGTVYDTNGGTNYAQIGTIYDYNGSNYALLYAANSNTYTITASATQDRVWAKSSEITNSGGYTKMVIESASSEKGNYGENIVELYCNGSKVLSVTGWSWYDPNISSWAGKSFTISNNGKVYVRTYTDRDENRDDGQDPFNATIKFHFE